MNGHDELRENKDRGAVDYLADVPHYEQVLALPYLQILIYNHWPAKFVIC